MCVCGAYLGAYLCCWKARVTGVAFFDYKRGQTGFAQNAIESSVRCSTSRVPPLSGATQLASSVAKLGSGCASAAGLGTNPRDDGALV